MRKSPNSLWPEDLVMTADPRSPKSILEEQAAALAPLTHNKVIATVVASSQSTWVTLDFVLVAPALNNYRYKLFKVRHKLHPEYPAEIVWDANLTVKDEDSLRERLAKIFRAETTSRVLSELMAYGTAANVEEESSEGPVPPSSPR